MKRKLRIFVDGCSRGNPGPAGIGYLIFDEGGRLLSKKWKHVGLRTNNEAEYLAAIEALKEALSLGASEIELLSDSELLVKQIRGEYAVRSDRLAPLHEELIRLVRSFEKFIVKHIERDGNREADRLAKLAASSSLEI
ncbi:MAG: ribonuclease HI family protein [Thaumarchaeota archaeon]|nr:ribonuclease HI family protein [Nitrososphaerota archaeon]MCL7386649.1 ribonuclease HI family protein [Candidatus Wolframiiraptor allenii]